MSNSPNKKMYPRPLKFNSTMQDFVFGSSWQSQRKRKASPPQKKIVQPNIANKSLFDQYNRNNLLLTMCNAADIQVLVKNPIAYEQKIFVHSPPPKQRPKNYSGKSSKKQNIQNQQVNVQQSEETKLNEFLFNYRKIEDQKKNKKKKFLEDVEAKLSALQKEAQSLQEHKQKQKNEIQDIIGINTRIREDIRSGETVGKLNTAIHESQGEQKREIRLRRVKEEMGTFELNQVLDQQQQYNQNLLEQIQRVTGNRSPLKSKELSKQFSKSKGKLGKTGLATGNLSKTLKKSIQPPLPNKKKLTSTWKGK